MDFVTNLFWHHDKFLGIEWHWWKVIGWLGNFVFFSRFMVQWYATEKRKQVVVPAAFSGITAACILAISRAIGETMIVAIAAGQQPRLTASPFVPVETMTAYIVQVSLGDTPQGTLEYRTIFAVGMLLFVMTFGLNLISTWLRERFREEYS